MMTLREALDLVPDFRSSQGRRHSLGAILALATCAMLCGARSLYAIAQWGRDQGGATAQLLGFSQEKIPCVATLRGLNPLLECRRLLTGCSRTWTWRPLRQKSATGWQIAG